MKHTQEYVYEYPHSKKKLLAQLDNRRGINHNYRFGEYLIEIKSDNCFFLGVQRGGHSGGGYWYIARIAEAESGAPIIRGGIVYNPDNHGNPQKEAFPDRIEFFLLSVLLLPVILIIKAAQLFRMLLLKIRKKPLPRPAEEVNLDRFMTEYLHCRKLQS